VFQSFSKSQSDKIKPKKDAQIVQAICFIDTVTASFFNFQSHDPKVERVDCKKVEIRFRYPQSFYVSIVGQSLERGNQQQKTDRKLSVKPLEV